MQEDKRHTAIRLSHGNSDAHDARGVRADRQHVSIFLVVFDMQNKFKRQLSEVGYQRALIERVVRLFILEFTFQYLFWEHDD